MAESRGYQWFIFLFTTAIVVICIINLVNYYQIKSNFDAYKVTVAFTADPIGTPATPIPPTNIGKGLAYSNGDLVSVTNASLTGFQRGSFNVTLTIYDINTGDATFANATAVDGTSFGPSTYNIAPTVNPDGMSEGSILTGLWINWILLILTFIVWLWRVYLFFFPPSSAAVVSEYFGEKFEAGTGYAATGAKALGQAIYNKFKREGKSDKEASDVATAVSETIRNGGTQEQASNAAGIAAANATGSVQEGSSVASTVSQFFKGAGSKLNNYYQALKNKFKREGRSEQEATQEADEGLRIFEQMSPEEQTLTQSLLGNRGYVPPTILENQPRDYLFQRPSSEQYMQFVSQQ